MDGFREREDLEESLNLSVLGDLGSEPEPCSAHATEKGCDIQKEMRGR